MHTDTPERFEYAVEALSDTYDVSAPDTEFTPSPIVLDRIA